MRINNIITGLFLIASLFACNHTSQTNDNTVRDTSKEEIQINAMLDSFNRAAAKADFNAYFNFYTDDAIFTGTDATERWVKKDFMVWAKPIFERGRAWDFTSLQRNIYFDKSGELAWFDELLKTQMEICRGSGVLEKQGNDWKVQQYILSATVPNELIDSVTKMKTGIEDSLMKKLSTQ